MLKKLLLLLALMLLIQTPVYASEEYAAGNIALAQENLYGEQAALCFGDSGPYVEKLQQRLKELRFYRKDETGQFDRYTLSCVLAFQKSKQLETDGFVGPLTQKALKKANAPSMLTVKKCMAWAVSFLSEQDQPAQKAYAYGDFGRLLIPDLQIDLALNYCNFYTASSAYLQYLTDLAGAAIYMGFSGWQADVIGDHYNQGFGTLLNAAAGMRCYIEQPDGSRRTFTCDGCGYGRNTGFVLVDQYGRAWESWPAGTIVMYTCSGSGNWQDIFLCQWHEG